MDAMSPLSVFHRTAILSDPMDKDLHEIRARLGEGDDRLGGGSRALGGCRHGPVPRSGGAPLRIERSISNVRSAGPGLSLSSFMGTCGLC